MNYLEGNSSTPKKLLQRLTVSSVIAFILIFSTTCIGLNILLKSFYIAEAEQMAIWLSDNVLRGDVPQVLTRSNVSSLENDPFVRSAIEGTDIVKIRIFSVNGIELYSTETSTVSVNVSADDPHLDESLTGKVTSMFLPGYVKADASGAKTGNMEIVVSYVPLTNSDNEMVGVLQTHIDISRYKRAVKGPLVNLVLLISFLTIAAFCLLAMLFRSKILELVTMQEELLRISATDSLTGLFDRKEVFKQLENEFIRLQKDVGRKEDIKSIGCVIAEIDQLKKINDIYGYRVGDNIIEFVSKRLVDTLRPYDIAGRYGGEDFILVLPNTSLVDAQKAANRICATIRASELKSLGIEFTVTMSIGVSCLTDYDTSADDAIKRAEASLNKARESGHDRVCWDEDLEI